MLITFQNTLKGMIWTLPLIIGFSKHRTRGLFDSLQISYPQVINKLSTGYQHLVKTKKPFKQPINPDFFKVIHKKQAHLLLSLFHIIL